MVGCFPDAEPGFSLVEQVEPVLRAFDAKSVGLPGITVQLTRIQNFQFILLLIETGYDPDQPPIDLFADAMFDGVFHQGLQHHWRDGLL